MRCGQCGHIDRYSRSRCWVCEPPSLDTVHGRLRRCLLDQKMSVTRLAELTGFDRGALGNTFAYDRAFSLVFIECAAQVLNVSPGWLAFGDKA